MENRIDTFVFIDLAGPAPEKVRKQVQVLARASVDGVTLVDQGKRGTPFTLRSRVDARDLEHARALYAAYCELIGEDPVDLVYQDLDLSSLESCQFAVLNVGPPQIGPMAAASGGLNSPSNAWLECDWTLIALEQD